MSSPSSVPTDSGPLSLGRRQAVHRPCEAVKRRKPTTITRNNEGASELVGDAIVPPTCGFCSRRTFPYKEGVAGSSPAAPTGILQVRPYGLRPHGPTGHPR